MATSITVKGKQVTRPGAYSDIKSGVKNNPTGLSYGNVLIIDTNNLLDDWAAGGGINGTLTKNSDAIYSFDNIQDYRNHVKGGYLWYLGERLFFPRRGSQGANKVLVVKPSTTAPAEITLDSLTNGSIVFQTKDEGTGANGALTSTNLSKGYAVQLLAGVQNTSKFYVKFFRATYRGSDTFNSGYYFNNTAPGTAKPELLVQTPEITTIQELVDWCNSNNTFKKFFKLKAGYVVSDAEITSVTTTADVADALNGKYFLINSPTVSYYVWYKTSGGVETDPALVGKTGLKVTVTTGDTANAVATATALVLNAHAAFVAPAPGAAIITVTNAVAGVAVDAGVGTSGFTISTSDQGSGDFVAGDLSTYTGYTLAAGGTESADSDDLAAVFNYINDLDFNFILSTSCAGDAQSVENSTILTFLQNTSKYDRLLFVGGGYDDTTFSEDQANSSGETAAYFDSDLVTVVHGGVKKSVPGSVDFKVYDSLAKTFQVVGRIAGLESQTSATLKALDIDGEVHLLTEVEQETALEQGVLYTYYDPELENFVIGQGINSLQNNINLVNDDGTTFSIAVKRIASQLSKEIVFNAKRTFYPSDSGPNRNTLSKESIASWLEGFLSKKIATPIQDNLITSFRDITVTETADNYEISYGFVPNFEVNKMVFTGFILDK